MDDMVEERGGMQGVCSKKEKGKNGSSSSMSEIWCEFNSILDGTVSRMRPWEKKMSTELEKKDEEILALKKTLQQADSVVENMKNEVCRLNRDHQDTVSQMEAEWEKKMSTELEKKDEENLSLKKTLQQADSDLEHIEHRVHKLNQDHQDTVSQIEAKWEKTMNTELEKKDEEILSLKKTLQHADSVVENMKNEVCRLNRDHQDTVSQMEAEWEKKINTELEKKDEEILSLKKTLQHADSVVENMKNEVCRLNRDHQDTVSQMEAEWEKKINTELEKKDEEILSLKKTLQQANSRVENMEREVCRLNSYHQDTVSLMEAEWVKETIIEMEKKDEEILSLTKTLQHADSGVENMKNEVCRLNRDHQDTVSQMEAEWEKKMNTELEKKDEEILSLKKTLQQANSRVENMEREVCRLNRDHQDTVSLMEAEWVKETIIEMEKKDQEILSLKKTLQQGKRRLEHIRNALNCVFDDNVSLNGAEREKTTDTELEKKDEEILSLMDVQHHNGIVPLSPPLEEDTVDTMIDLQKEYEEKLTDERQETKKQVTALTNENCELLTQISTLGNKDAEWDTQYGVLQTQHLTLIEEKEKKTQEMELLVKENAELKVLTATSGKPRKRRNRTKKKKTKDGEME
ncbi:girdin-like [Gouania willdenowi]|uniref:girdin-like n=1 Tax=Gouania willdenowi TaxID=441366 RepID=UPI001054F376|nr:girdin-like [Gouania willdenowi]